MSNALISFLKHFHSISTDDEPLIAAATEYRVYKEGDYLFKAGKVCREMFFVCKGILRIVVDNESGNEVTHFFIRENKLCSILNSFNNNVIANENIQAYCANPNQPG